MTKIEYYKQIKTYSRVSLFARDLNDDESFQKFKSNLSQTVGRMITIQRANMIEREHRLAKRGCMIVFNQQDHNLLDKLNDLKNKIDYNEPVIKCDYDGTYIKQTFMFGLSPSETCVLLSCIVIVASIVEKLF